MVVAGSSPVSCSCPLYANTLPLGAGVNCGGPPAIADPNSDCNLDGIPTECQCGDADGNGILNGFDSLLQLQCGAFPATCVAGPAMCTGVGTPLPCCTGPGTGPTCINIDLWDANGDGIIGPLDLATLLGAWGPCP